MPKSCTCILKRLRFKKAISQEEYDKLSRNLIKPTTEVDMGAGYGCAVCNHDFGHFLYNFCPNCGRRIVPECDFHKEEENE